jgi:PAS domain S-box-containing protein
VGALIIVLLLIRQIISYNEISHLYHSAENEISKRVKAEKILKIERDNAQRYLDIAGVIILVLDPAGKVILINKKGSEVLGYTENEIIGKKWSSTFIPEKNRAEVQDIFNQIISDEFEQYTAHEYPVLSKNGEELIISWNNSLIRKNTGNITGVISSGEDITQKRIDDYEREEKTKKTIKRQNALLSLSRKDISELKLFLRDLTEVDSKILNVERVSIWFFNEEMTEIHCKDLYTSSDNSHHEGNVLEADTYPNYFKAIKKFHSIAAKDAQNDPLTNEFSDTYLKPLGIVSMMDAPIWLKGKLIGVLCHEHVGEKLREWNLEEQDFAGSITNMISLSLEADERQKAEAKIKESLEEKKVLLKEIHHRVKNNMQIISSLLNLQARQINDPEAAEIFKESQSRVKSMSMIHERLYQSKTLSSINFAEYINSLSLDLLRTYASNPNKIELNINAEKIKINIDTAIPCGLILTELVSNAFKYAFPDERNGEININFYKKGDVLTLKISDNGVGIPKSLDYTTSKTLGLLLVNSLIKQIDGEIDLDTSNGTSFTLTFKEVNYEDRI